jgi:hypothetical protein
VSEVTRTSEPHIAGGLCFCELCAQKDLVKQLRLQLAEQLKYLDELQKHHRASKPTPKDMQLIVDI